MLHQLRRDVIGDTLDAQVEKPFDSDAATDGLSMKLLTSSSFMALIVTFVGRELDTAILDQNALIAKALKRKPATNTEEYGDIIKEPSSPSDFEIEEPNRSRSSKRWWKNFYAKRKGSQANWHPLSSKPSNRKYDSQTKLESNDKVLTMHKRHERHRKVRDSRTESDRRLTTIAKIDTVVRKISWSYARPMLVQGTARLLDTQSRQYVVVLRWKGC